MTSHSTIVRGLSAGVSPAVRLVLLGGCVLATAVACASGPRVATRETILAYDSAAHAAVDSEGRIDPARIPARAIGVLPFSVRAGDTLLRPLGYAMAEFMTTDLARATGRLEVVDRLRTDAILRELKLVEQGIVDPTTAPRIGKLVGARRVLTASLSALPNGNVLYSVRIVDVTSSQVDTVIVAQAPLARAIDAEKKLAIEAFRILGVAVTPALSDAIERHQAGNLAATVAFGKGLDAESRGDVVAAAAAFEQASRLDASFVEAREFAAATSSALATRIASASSLRRVLDLSANGINPPIPTKLPEAVDAPLQTSSQVVALIINVRVF